MSDPYTILGINRTFEGQKATRAAYHRLAHKYHPDKIMEPTKRARGEEKFKEL
jgi:DnaJ-class molecular chaperone